MPLKPHFSHYLILSLFFLCQNAMSQDTILSGDSVFVNSSDSIYTNASDSISANETDSVKKNNAIDAPVQYTAKDSMVMILDGQNMLYLYGEGSVKYMDMDLQAEYIEVDADSSLIFATFGLDSIGDEFGYPYFKEGQSEYEMKKVRYNFKTKKMFITDVITQQGEGYISGGTTKKMPNDDLYMENVKYTTCDEPDHPHFYLLMTKGKIRPKKNVVAGPTYLVVEDVPLPIAVPFAFFPFSSDYSSGIIMPTYGDEMRRGFSLRNGGYYFAFNDHVDLALTGEIYTKGSWGLNAKSSYKKRYRYTGNLDASYLITIEGEKGDPDYSKSTDFKVNWNHSQDAKANPFSTFTANVSFSTSQYNRKQLENLYSSSATENQKRSSVSWSFKHPNSPVSLRSSAQISQISRDTTVSVTFPDLTITASEFYPFKRKDQVGNQRWYEKIRMSYTGTLTNKISNVKEYDFFDKSIIKDWNNGMKHSIPISASFNALKYITITPNISYTERWYTNKVSMKYDPTKGSLAPSDTTYGFYRVYDYSGSISANTKLYGMYKPWSFLGKWTKGVQIRHVLTPSISFNGAPDFSDPKYGFYEEVYIYDDEHNKYGVEKYSPFRNGIYGIPGEGKSGTMNFSLDNNVEMKIPVAGTDSTRKISLIDNFRLSSGYNFLKDSLNWSDISASLRLKLGKSYTLSLSGTFETYTYNYTERNGTVYPYKQNKTWWQDGRIFPYFLGTSQTFSYNLNNQTLKNLFKKKKDGDGDSSGPSDDPNAPPPSESEGSTEEGEGAPRTSLRAKKEDSGKYDSDGYFLTEIPWNLSLSYSLGFSKDASNFNKETRSYPYKITQSATVSGNISPTANWDFNFNASYDFDLKQFVRASCSITRKMHCWSMSANFIPVGMYKSYSFTISVSSSMLQDLKYTQSSNYRDALNWGD